MYMEHYNRMQDCFWFIRGKQLWFFFILCLVYIHKMHENYFLLWNWWYMKLFSMLFDRVLICTTFEIWLDLMEKLQRVITVTSCPVVCLVVRRYVNLNGKVTSNKFLLMLLSWSKIFKGQPLIDWIFCAKFFVHIKGKSESIDSIQGILTSRNTYINWPNTQTASLGCR